MYCVNLIDFWYIIKKLFRITLIGKKHKKLQIRIIVQLLVKTKSISIRDFTDSDINDSRAAIEYPEAAWNPNRVLRGLNKCSKQDIHTMELFISTCSVWDQDLAKCFDIRNCEQCGFRLFPFQFWLELDIGWTLTSSNFCFLFKVVFYQKQKFTD